MVVNFHLLITSPEHTVVSFRLDLIFDAITMNPIRPLHCLQYRLPKTINRQKEPMTKVVTGVERVYVCFGC